MDETLNMEMMGTMVKIYMFGEFRICIGDAVITDEINRSGMMWNLLAYLIVHRDRNILQSEFEDVLWPGDSENSSSALKTLLYRTRLTLAPIIGEELRLILSQRGSYSWNRNLNCCVDIEEFSEVCYKLENETMSEEDRFAAYRKAISLYKGVFLPKLAAQLWLRPISLHYHETYLKTVKGFAGLLIKNNLFEELAGLCGKALEIDIYDEQLHSLMVLAMIRLGDYQGALKHYERATDLLYRNLGVQPSRRLRELYLEIMKDQKNLEVDLNFIQHDMRERDENAGAFIVEPGFFREAYRLEVRRAPRQGISVHLALMTVATETGDVPELDILNKTMGRLLEVITQTLRKGDVVSRYSGAQYVFLLPTASYENAEMVMRRILRGFARQYPRDKLKIGYKLRQIELSM
ncbi:MAG: hypothetical protein LBL09_01480 [Oscillospiraceae bacterium]|jgi:DNA-binding SARP family transcriptional activator|nr:hypothetical protein [Oscillospiraceae bacterium]